MATESDTNNHSEQQFDSNSAGDNLNKAESQVTFSAESVVLTKAQKAQIERNRQRALLVREDRNRKRAGFNTAGQSSPQKVPRKVIDTGGGFLLEEEEFVKITSTVKIIHPPAPLLEPGSLVCEECSKGFTESYLFSKFSRPICDACKDINDKHRLVTRTDAKEKYLLKDSDLDCREPILPYILKKNPRNEHWGEMKLYLEVQVAELAQTIWGSDESLDQVKAERQSNREQMKKKKYDKKVKDLRRAVRGSLYKKATAGHEHEFSAEIYDEANDTYSKTCTSCGHVSTYEKM